MLAGKREGKERCEAEGRFLQEQPSDHARCAASLDYRHKSRRKKRSGKGKYRDLHASEATVKT